MTFSNGILKISGEGYFFNWVKNSLVINLKQKPFFTLPALPALWFKLAIDAHFKFKHSLLFLVW
jgi:hypothetical protein